MNFIREYILIKFKYILTTTIFGLEILFYRVVVIVIDDVVMNKIDYNL